MKLLSIIGVAFLAGCSFLDDGVYTLYRTSATLSNARIHVGTFDAADGDEYNSYNCNTAAGLFARQPKIQVRYWCEKGKFHK